MVDRSPSGNGELALEAGKEVPAAIHFLQERNLPVLVLARKVDQKVVIDNGRIVLTVTKISGNTVRLGFEASRDIPIDRAEVLERAAPEYQASGDPEADVEP